MNQLQLAQRIMETYPQSQATVQDTTGGEDHFDVLIQCPQLATLSRIAGHKAVLNLFEAELKSGEIHALSIRIAPPSKITGDNKNGN